LCGEIKTVGVEFQPIIVIALIIDIDGCLIKSDVALRVFAQCVDLRSQYLHQHFSNHVRHRPLEPSNEIGVVVWWK
jgi:hypothetical protein